MKQRNKWKRKIVKSLSVVLTCLLFASIMQVNAIAEGTCRVKIVDEFYDDNGNFIESVVRVEEEVAYSKYVRYEDTYYKGYVQYESQLRKPSVYEGWIYEDTTIYFRYVPAYGDIGYTCLVFDVAELTEDELYTIGNSDTWRRKELGQKLKSEIDYATEERRAGEEIEIKAPVFEGYKLLGEESSYICTIPVESIKAVLPDEYKTVYQYSGSYGGNGGIYIQFLYVLDKSTVLGDVNSDGDINANDALEILKKVAGMSTFTEEQMVLADVTNDNVCDANDALTILKYVVGMIEEF